METTVFKICWKVFSKRPDLQQGLAQSKCSIKGSNSNDKNNSNNNF